MQGVICKIDLFPLPQLGTDLRFVPIHPSLRRSLPVCWLYGRTIVKIVYLVLIIAQDNGLQSRLYQAQELLSRLRALPHGPKHAAGDGRGTRLLYASRAHAHMSALHHNANALRSQNITKGHGDLFR